MSFWQTCNKTSQDKLVLMPELCLLLYAAFQTSDNDDVTAGENNTFFENLEVTGLYSKWLYLVQSHSSPNRYYSHFTGEDTKAQRG